VCVFERASECAYNSHELLITKKRTKKTTYTYLALVNTSYNWQWKTS